MRPDSAEAGVAQLVEHLICNQRVGGSNPSASSIFQNVRPGHTVESKSLRIAEILHGPLSQKNGGGGGWLISENAARR